MSDLLKKTVELAGAYVGRNEISTQEVTRLINDIFSALKGISDKMGSEEQVSELLPLPKRNGAPLGRPRKIREIVDLEAPANMEVDIMEPALSLEDAVTDDVVYCLICGKGCRALKGHLDRIHNLDVDTYRAKFRLERDFPLVAPAYSEKRRQLALTSGLGDRSRRNVREK